MILAKHHISFILIKSLTDENQSVLPQKQVDEKHGGHKLQKQQYHQARYIQPELASEKEEFAFLKTTRF